ncbi:PQQ-dependent sugar dehydrogenase [Halomicrobium salinisoli]|uniref:PQQ-dependent sugar dehydrogenase n=1 Tax=Halomicrobium salinisoli TaxID=2878391 RepID=UPI001CF01276|nr:PQQ-dependent sugar dehydrogenase [Halomicrobium salinisoli]
MTGENNTDEAGERSVQSRIRSSRRRFLQAAGATALAGGAGFGMAQEDATTYRFGGEVAGWQGRAPSEIEGETNPTIELEAGTEYEVVWENLDGQPHDFVIQDDQGNDLVGTEITEEEGATLSFTFTASEEMAQYICTVHPTTMIGDIEMAGGDGGAMDGEQPAQQRYVPEGPTVGAELVADGPLVNPVTLRSVPGQQDTHLIVDQPGLIYVHQDGELQEEPFMDISDWVMMLADTQGGYDRAPGFDERGLLGMDFHPDFEENGQFYLRYSSAEPRSDGDSLVGPGDREYPEDWDHVGILSEFQLSDGGGDQLQGDPESERVLLEVPEPQFNHNGGEIVFGPDGYLYATLGDGGGANDTGPGHVEDWYDENDGGNGQDVTENLLGSVLRIDVDQEGEDRPYAVPDDNPLVDTEAYDEYFAWGLRNPWRASFNDGALITADVGQALFEEVDVIQRGGNYGWNVREGFHCFNADNATEPLDECPSSAPDEAPFDGQPLLDPVAEYPHTYQGNPVGISITGGYVYQGDEVSDLSGQYLFGDWSVSFVEPQGRIFVATTSDLGGAAATDEPSVGGGNMTAGNMTDGNMTAGNGTDAVGNVTVGQEGGGNVSDELTGDNATVGNESDGEVPEVQVEEDLDILQPSEQPWPYEEVLIAGGENQQLNRFIQAFGRDDQGNVYVLASRTGRLESEAGEVYRLVPEGDGQEISQPDVDIPMPGEEGDGNETDANATDANATADNETAD